MGEVFMAYKVNNEIITNIDVENESRYLMALNTQLRNLDEKKIISIAKDSIIKETIKKIELQKYFKLNQKNPYLNTIVKDFYIKLNLNDEIEFETYLNKYNLTINDVKKKMEIETTWNQLIFEKYKNQINIDEDKIKQRIKNKIPSKENKKYLLSEIVFEKKADQTVKQKINNINESIKEIGFKNTANIYSVSDSSKFGGNIGWVEESKLSSKLASVVEKLNIGEITTPIQIGNGFLIIKLNDIKSEIIKIDEKKELKKLIRFEQNRQLDQFSKIYFNKIKINTKISEL
jgi:peptidyl-prolyl cis-trans isomerase SurA